MSDPPRRWIDDPDAPVSARDSLRGALSVEPPAYDVDAGLARFEAAGGASAAASSIPSWLVPVGAVALAAAVATGIVASRRSDDEARSPAPMGAAAPEHEPRPIPAPASPPVAGPPSSSPEAAAVRDDAAVASPTVPTPPRTAVTATPAAKRIEPAPPPEAAAPDDAIRREIEALARARAALASRPAQAVELVDAADREFSPGLFREERAAIRVLALSALGRPDEAAQHGREFLRRWPSSNFADRVRAAIDG
jgi:hypothetical protein